MFIPGPNRYARRRTQLERLEQRTPLAADWQNPVDRLDVDGSGIVTPIDALVLINDMVHNGGSRRLGALNDGALPPPYLDVNGNDFVEPLDVLAVINYLNLDPQDAELLVQRFLVDVTTGNVRVDLENSAEHDGGEAEAMFVGTTLVFNTTELLDRPGDAGLKTLRVSLTNQSGMPLGQLPSGRVTGLRVVFSDFTNVLLPADWRSKTTVATLAGTGAAGSTDAPQEAASFNNPNGIVVSPTGELYVVDFTNRLIRKVSNGLVSTLAGGPGIGSVDGSGTSASFTSPWGIARNPFDGSLIVTEFGGHRIRRVTVDGEVTTIAGTGVAGDTNGGGNVAMFNNPAGVAVSTDGTIYVAEANGHRIRKIVLVGSNPRLASSYSVSVLAGSTASPPAAGFLEGTGSVARFSNPRGIAVDDAGVIYVSDMGNRRIRRITPNAEVATIAGNGVAGSTDGPGHLATFQATQGLAIVPGTKTLLASNLHVIRQITLKPDASPANAASWDVTTVAGTGASGAIDGNGTTATFNLPIGITVDAAHNVYVVDFHNHLIRRLTLTNGFFPIGIPVAAPPAEPVRLSNADGLIPIPNPVVSATPVLLGTRPFIQYEEVVEHGQSSDAEEWSFIVPDGVTAFEFTATVEANTNFLAPVTAVSNPGPGGVGSPANNVRTIAGAALGGLVNGSATEARFTSAIGITADRFGNRYVADTGNHAIRRIAPDGSVATIAGTSGILGSIDGDGTNAQFNNPSAVAVTADGQTLFVTDSGNHRIRRVALVPFTDPTQPANWNVSTIAGFSADYVDNTTGNLARLNYPFGIAISDGGLIYVSELSGNRIRRLQQTGANPASSLSWRVSLVAGSTAAPVGTPGATDSNGGSARFNSPRLIAVDQVGNIYVADSLNSRIRRITPNSDVSTLAGTSFGYADGPGNTAMFGQPNGIAVDSAGYLYVADTVNHRIRRISPTGVVTTVAGIGISFPGDLDGTGDVSVFYYPQGIAVDETGSLLVTSGGTYQSVGGGTTTSPGLRIRLIERIFTTGEA